MMLKRPAIERGHADHGWLKAFHSFSFASYYDPENMGFRSLRVLNDDTVQPGQGFGTHGHKNMEIITYVLDGAIEHKDSMGSGSVLRPGDVQLMSAGHGVTHSEFNHSQDELLHLLQIWILPEKEGLEPTYQETHFPAAERQGQLRLIASPDGTDGSLKMNQDARVYASLLADGETLNYDLQEGRHLWLQVAKGKIEANGVSLQQGDGLAVSEESALKISGVEQAEFLLFDLN